jgi:hypothetical protein
LVRSLYRGEARGVLAESAARLLECFDVLGVSLAQHQSDERLLAGKLGAGCGEVLVKRLYLGRQDCGG